MVISLGRGDYKGGYVVVCAAVIGEDVRNDLIKIMFECILLLRSSETGDTGGRAR